VKAPTTVTLPTEGRVFRHRDRVTLADVSPAGRARLDALARWLQDAAYDDSMRWIADAAGAVVATLRVEPLTQTAGSRSAISASGAPQFSIEAGIAIP
jgi:hypothetical protein